MSMSNVEQAEGVAAELRAKRDALVAHGIELGEERAKISFAAHTGDKGARQRLDKLNAEIALHESELRSLDAAIGEAGARVERALQAAATAADREKAEEARKLVKEIGECFPFLDRHLAEAARALVAIHDGVAKLHAAGFASPSDNQLRLAVAAIIQTWAHRLPRSWHNQLRDGLQFLAPHERKSAVQYWTAVEPALQNTIRQAAGEPQKEESA
jgi:hypothetical protein